MAPPLIGNTASQHFRPSTENGGGTWNFTCDFLLPLFKLAIDLATLNAKMNDTPAQGVEFIFNTQGRI